MRGLVDVGGIGEQSVMRLALVIAQHRVAEPRPVVREARGQIVLVLVEGRGSSDVTPV
ncbi:hypothetical protein [Rhizobium sp. LjRoot258]|uniref:hypothetical protein n=1 Tax=Rhizobium sp. LjRoot258 TaxID=3342299 RepID=UPI003F5079EE